MRPSALITGLSLLLLSGAPEARADGKRTAVIAPEEERGAAVREAAEATLRELGETAVNADDAKVDAGTIRACVAAGGGCAKAFARAACDRVMVLSLEGEGAEVALTGWLLSATTGEALAVDRRYCESCDSIEALSASARELTAAVLAGIGVGVEEAAFVEVHTVPAGAVIEIEGERAGVSGRPFKVAPGAVDIVARKKRFLTAHRRVRVKAGETRIVKIELDSLEPPGPRPLRTAAWASLAVGGGALMLGVTWMALDGPRFDGDGNRLPRRRNSLLAGGISAGLGTALIGTSAYLFWRDLRVEDKREERKRRQVILSPTQDGWVMGVRGSF